VISRSRAAWIGTVVVLCATVVAYGFVEGNRFNRRQIKIRLGAGPLVGRYEIRFGWGTLPVVVLAAAVVVYGPRVASRARRRWLELSTAAATTAFTALLAAIDGPTRVIEPITHPTEYWQVLDRAPSIGTFVSTYTDQLKGYSVHIRGHPPGYTVLLLAGRALGITSPWVVAAVSWMAAGLAAAMVVLTVRHVAGLDQARRLAPLLVVAPYAVWAGTSADAVYMGLAAAGVACVAVAGHAEALTDVRRWWWAAAGGGLLGIVLFGTYGAVMMAPIGLAVVVASRYWQLLVAALAAVALVVAVWAAAGFWWLDGARATQEEYWLGTAQFREPWRFAVFNVAALLVALGPVVALGFGFVRRSPWMWLVGGALLAVAAANASQYSKGEVERIWLLFMPWLTVAALGVLRRTWICTAAVATQAATAIVIQTLLVSKW
jgi:hypothetical protein